MISEPDIVALCTYIKAGLEQGRSKEELKQALQQQGGWPALDIDIAFAHLSQTRKPTSLPSSEPPQPQSTTINVTDNANMHQEPSGMHGWQTPDSQSTQNFDKTPNTVARPAKLFSSPATQTYQQSPQPFNSLDTPSTPNTSSTMRKGKIAVGVRIVAVTCLAVGLAGFFTYRHMSTQDSSLPPGVVADRPASHTLDDQHTLVMPAIVRVLHDIKGTLHVTPFRVDVDKLSIEKLPSDTKPLTKDFDTQVSGTAFSISESGLFATNAHVVSTDIIRMGASLEVMFSMLMQEYLRLVKKYGAESPEATHYTERLEEISEMDPNDPRGKEIALAVLALIQFNDSGSTVRLLPQETALKTRDDLKEVGIEAQSLIVPKDWLETERDVALVVVDPLLSTLPALAINTSSGTLINQSVAAYGFPGATDTSIDSFANVTVTQGRVTSSKIIPGSTIETLQTDAKVSKGSSGGPLVNMEGEVIGIITLESGSEDGDNFAFALPSTIIKELAYANGHPALTTKYQEYINAGLVLKEHRRCARANEAFNSARNLLGNSLVTHTEVDAYISECDTVIKSGQSLDSKWDSFREDMKAISSTTLLLIGVGFFFVVFMLALMIALLRKMRKDQARIQSLEREVHHTQ